MAASCTHSYWGSNPVSELVPGSMLNCRAILAFIALKELIILGVKMVWDACYR